MMSKWFKIILILLALGTLTAALVFKFVYNKPHPDFEEEQAIFSLEVEEIYDSYKKNHVLADEMYLGQVVELKGEISTIEENDGLKKEELKKVVRYYNWSDDTNKSNALLSEWGVQADDITKWAEAI